MSVNNSVAVKITRDLRFESQSVRVVTTSDWGDILIIIDKWQVRLLHNDYLSLLQSHLVLPYYKPQNMLSTTFLIILKLSQEHKNQTILTMTTMTKSSNNN